MPRRSFAPGDSCRRLPCRAASPPRSLALGDRGLPGEAALPSVRDQPSLRSACSAVRSTDNVVEVPNIDVPPYSTPCIERSRDKEPCEETSGLWLWDAGPALSVGKGSALVSARVGRGRGCV